MKYEVTCPYCGARAVCVPASSLFGGMVRRKGDYIYRCSRWPVCDAYVSAHRRDHRPMGTLANACLRRKRMQAHEALDTMCRSRGMDKWAAYLWLQCKLRLEPEQTHIGLFSEAQCDHVIALCRGHPPDLTIHHL